MTDTKFSHEAMFRELIKEELEKAGRQNSSNRVTFQEDERKYWIGWLPDDLGRRADQIKKFVEVLYEDNGQHPPLKHYTPHGIPHCKAVEDNLHRLIPNEMHKHLTEKEKFFLIIAAWVHDIGMLRGIFHEDQHEDDYIRDFHHERSERYLSNHYKLIGINEEEAATLGLLARFHRRRCNIEECPYYLTISNKDTVRLRLMAAYLRLADALHIDQSRTPGNQYAISLAYNIPYKSKLHWYRSKFVHGVRVDVEEKSITVQLKRPKVRDEDRKYKKLDEKYDIIYDLIIDDLNEEIESVKNVLFKEGITYFLSAKKEVISVEVDDIFKKDVQPVLHYYHLLDNPSSSALVTLVIEAIESIASSENRNKCAETTDIDSIENKKIKKEIEKFLSEIENNVLSSRKCHAALSNLIARIRKDVIESNNFKNEKEKINSIADWIEREKRIIEENKSSVRYNSAKYLKFNSSDDIKDIIRKHFEKDINEVLERYSGCDSKNNKPSLEGEPSKKINILLYGYSELSIETICGFRDAVAAMAANEYRIKKQQCALQNDGSDRNVIEDIDLLFYQHETIEKFEKEASDCFRIFCCEGQPKNHTTWNGRYHHHDGSMYALEFAKKKFKEINIIPDAAAASIISMASVKEEDNCFPDINFIIIGTNGFDKDRFMHSSGHSMIIAASTIANKEKKPKVVLSLITDKFKENKDGDGDGHKEQGKSKDQKREYIENGGWYFRNGFSREQVRDHAFFTQDSELQKQFYKYKDIIRFYNPREDGVDIKLVDIVVSEKGYLIKEDAGDRWNGEFIRNGGKSNNVAINQEKQGDSAQS